LGRGERGGIGRARAQRFPVSTDAEVCVYRPPLITSKQLRPHHPLPQNDPLQSSYTLLHVAAGLGQARCLKLLINSGLSPIDSSGSSGDGATPLHAAAMAGSVECAEVLLSKGEAAVGFVASRALC